MTEIRRACGTLTVAQLNKALKGFPRMSDKSRTMAKQYLVDGHLQVDVAKKAKVSRERVRFVCAKVYEAYQTMATPPAGQAPAPVTNSERAQPALTTSNATKGR